MAKSSFHFRVNPTNGIVRTTRLGRRHDGDDSVFITNAIVVKRGRKEERRRLFISESLKITVSKKQRNKNKQENTKRYCTITACGLS